MSCGSNPNDALNKQNAQTLNAQNKAIGQINSAFSGFSPDFFQGVAKAYQNYQTPALMQQYNTNSNNLKFKLANQGLSDSTQARTGFGALNDAMAQGQAQIGQKGQEQAQQLQQQIGQEQSNLVGQASASQNPGAIASSALGVANNFKAPSTFAPIGSFFSDFAQNYFGGQQANTYNNATNQLLQLNQLGRLLNPTY